MNQIASPTESKSAGNRLFSAIMEAIIPVIISSALPIALTFYSPDDGVIRQGNSVLLGGVKYRVIDIENKSTNPIDGLQLSIPSSMMIASVSSSNPIQIKPVADVAVSNNHTIIDISSVPPRQLTRVYFPVSKEDSNQYIEPINNRKLNISLDNDYIEKPTLLSRLTAPILANAISGLILFSAIFYFLNKNSEELKISRNNLSLKIDEVSNDFENLQRKSEERRKEIEVRLRKHSLYLHQKISDLNKEIDFWRSVVAKILHNKTTNIKPPDLMDAVTKTLGTFSTRSGNKMDLESFYKFVEITSQDQQGWSALDRKDRPKRN